MLYNFWYMASELEMPFELPANRTPLECLTVVTTFLKCAQLTIQGLKWLPLIVIIRNIKLKLWARMIKQLFSWLNVLYLIYLARESLNWAQLKAHSTDAISSDNLKHTTDIASHERKRHTYFSQVCQRNEVVTICRSLQVVTINHTSWTGLYASPSIGFPLSNKSDIGQQPTK